MKALAGVMLALLLLTGSAPALAQVPGAPETELAPITTVDTPPPDYSPYVGHPEAVSCLDFASQAAAQAMLRADPGDAMQVDSDRNGIACEANPEPRDLVPVPRTR